MTSLPTGVYAGIDTPFWLSAQASLATTPNVQVSTLFVNPVGSVVLTSDPVVDNANGSIFFLDPTNTSNSLMAYNNNLQYTNAEKYQISALDSSRTTYSDLASRSIVLYGNNLIGARPIATLQERLDLNTLEIVSPSVLTNNMFLSTLSVSSVNGLSYPPPGTGGGGGVSSIVSTFNFLYASNFFANNASISSLNISSITGFTGSLSASTIQSQFFLTSTLAFKPNLSNVGFSPTIDLGMGGFLGGIAGGLGSGVFNTILAGTALGTGIVGVTMPRGGGATSATNINSNAFELVNVTTQLQVSTLGTPTASVLRLVSSVSANVPGTEYFLYKEIPPGTACIRSISDPLNLANPTIATSTIQSFGQWVPLPSAVIADTIEFLTVSSINGIYWDQIQYANQQTVTLSTPEVIVNDSNDTLYIGFSLAFAGGFDYEYYNVPLIDGAYTYQGFVDMVNSILGQSALTQFNLVINPTTHIITINYTPLAFPQATSYTFIFNPATGAPYAPGNFNPAWTNASVTASSVLFGANLVNVTFTSTAPANVTLPQAVPTSIFTGRIPFGANLQVSTLIAQSNITSPLITTTNINLQTINGAAYPPSSSNVPLTSISSLSVSSINTVGWDTIQYWNVAPSLIGYAMNVVSNVNDAVFLNVTSSTNPLLNSNIVVRVPQSNYANVFQYYTALQTAINSAPAQFSNLGVTTNNLPGVTNGFLQYINNSVSSNNRFYQIVFNTAGIANFPGFTASQMSNVGVLQGASNNTNISIQPTSIQTLPLAPGTAVLSNKPFSADIQVSTLTANNNVFTNFINNTPWSTIQYFNQAPNLNFSDASFTVTSNNNILCVSAVNNNPPAFLVRNGFLLTPGSYTSVQFETMVNSVILLSAGTFSNRFNNLQYYNDQAIGFGFNSFFTNLPNIPPSPVGTFYNVDFTPANFASFPNATSNLIIGSAGLFGTPIPSTYTINPSCNAQMPIPNSNPVVTPPRPFGADLVVSSINIAGVGLISGTNIPAGSITMYAGRTVPTGYFFCDGSYKPVFQYPNLYTAIGFLYGSNTGSIGEIQFRLPNFQGRLPMGALNPTATDPPNSFQVFVSLTRATLYFANTILIETLSSTYDNEANVIFPGMKVTFVDNTITYNVIVTNIIFQQQSTSSPNHIYYLVNVDTPIADSGNSRINATASFDFANGGPYNVGYVGSIKYPQLSSINVPPHFHTSQVLRGGANASVNTGQGIPSGFPNQGYGSVNTSDGTTATDNSSTSIGQNGTPGLGVIMSNYGFNNAALFPNSNVTSFVPQQPFTTVNYIIKY